MKFIRITTGNYLIVHGYDTDNREITETVTVDAPTKKRVAIDWIQSVSEKYVLVTGSHGRLFYWEYTESFDELRGLLLTHNLLIN
ncbi:MAG: hypothetical protein H7Z72_11085 [Bacteroidetes bacterium]|nr:hypothetical protein [Fibrella sp.]